MSVDLKFLLLLNDIVRRVDRGVSLTAVARRAGMSAFRLHREFRRNAGETLKQFTLRLQLERAAAHLVTDNEEVLMIALTSGFASHEVFTRAFRRYYGVSPTEYRRRGLASASKAERQRHMALIKSIGPCIRFFINLRTRSIFNRGVPARCQRSALLEKK
jgi:AraC-like DNA-binding protein